MDITTISAIGGPLATIIAVALGAWLNFRLGTSTHLIVNDQRDKMVAEIDSLKDQIVSLKSEIRNSR